MKYPFTPRRFAELESMIADTKENADQVAQSGYQSGSEQDGHHDEGYQLSLQQVAVFERRLRDLMAIRVNAEIVIPEEQDRRVQLGNGVELIYPNGETLRFIVEGYVLGSSENTISIHSPLGRAITGARQGDEVSFEVGNRTITVIVEKIFLPSQAKRFCSS